jgi:hypothetical protein
MKSLIVRIAAPCAAHALLATSPLLAQQPASGAHVTWTSVAAGLGAAGATVTSDRAYEGSGQLLGRVGWTRGLGDHHAAEIEVLGTHEFGASDCIDSSPCGSPFSVAGAAINVLTPLARTLAADSPTLGAGPGVFRLTTPNGRAVSPRITAGAQSMAEAPIIAGSGAGLTLGIRGIVVPRVRGQVAWVVLVTSGVRVW